MKIIILAIVAAISFSGCASESLPHTRNLSTVTITWQRADADQIQLICGNGKAACARQTSYDTCIIWAKEPTNVKSLDVTYLGHEALHCFIGSFHD